MKRTREAVASAAANGLSVFAVGGLRLLPFELQFLARRWAALRASAFSVTDTSPLGGPDAYTMSVSSRASAVG